MTNERGNRTLIAYASRGGVTKEYSEIITEVLREKYGHEVDTAHAQLGEKLMTPTDTP